MEENGRVVIMKFGGTSVADAEAIARVVRHVMARAGRHSSNAQPVVVVSALAGVTDRLLALATAAEQADAQALRAGVEALRARHLQVAAEVAPKPIADLATAIDAEFAAIGALLDTAAAARHASPAVVDAVAGIGELLSSRIVHAALARAGAPAAWVDARRVIVTDDHFTAAIPLVADTETAIAREIRPLLAAGQMPVVGGYIAATRDGIPTTLGRGGSDYSAALLGAGLDACEIQIWTDVDGMMTTDPRMVSGARVVSQLSFGEASALAHFGAKVLHPGTILPAVAKGIPVRILNSRRFDGRGTEIASVASGGSNVAAIACKRRVTLVNFTSTRALMVWGFLRRVFEAFERHRTPVDLLAMSEAGVSVVIDDDRRLEAIVQGLADIAVAHVERGMAIVCVVGDGLREEPRLAERMMGALDRFQVWMVSQTASQRSLAVVLRDTDAAAATSRLHTEFFGARGPEEPLRHSRAADTAARAARGPVREIRP